jgi:phosphatidate cytidylyltransferase
MLMQRVATAAVLLPLLLAAIWWLPTAVLYDVFAAVGLLIAWEWSALMGLQRQGARFAYCALTAGLLALAWWCADAWAAVALVSLLWWVYAFFMVLGYPANFERQRPGVIVMGAIGQVLIVPTILSLAVLHGGGTLGPASDAAVVQSKDGAWRLLYVFFLIFAADTGAYFAGRRFGKRKLAAAVSPGKSIEGAIGGLLLCAVWAGTGGVAIFEPGTKLWMFVLLSLAVAAVSILGDLTESLFKRAAGVKDSGTILPGHGGILDRVDSLLAAAPAMALGLFALAL